MATNREDDTEATASRWARKRPYYDSPWGRMELANEAHERGEPLGPMLARLAGGTADEEPHPRRPLTRHVPAIGSGVPLRVVREGEEVGEVVDSLPDQPTEPLASPFPLGDPRLDELGRLLGITPRPSAYAPRAVGTGRGVEGLGIIKFAFRAGKAWGHRCWPHQVLSGEEILAVATSLCDQVTPKLAAHLSGVDLYDWQQRFRASYLMGYLVPAYDALSRML